METVEITGNLMFGMDMFDAIDLTDKSEAVTIAKDNKVAARERYTIEDHISRISSQYSLRIMDISKDTLTLNLVLSFGNENIGIKGDALEMRFVQMTAIQ